jgi:peroxiredoxin
MKRSVLFSLVASMVVCGFVLGPFAVVNAADDAKPATKPTVPPRRPAGKAAAKQKPAVKAPRVITQIEPAKLTMPKVVLTEAHAKTCLVKVGDSLPDLPLKDLAGKSQSINLLLGKKLTVIMFWTSDNSYSLEELTDLGPDVAKPYGEKAVNVIAIDEHDAPDAVQTLVKKLGVTVPVLLDPKGELLAKVSTRRLPRTYLVDDKGKILWFDTEYSSTTRRDLRDAIRVTLNGEG